MRTTSIFGAAFALFLLGCGGGGSNDNNAGRGEVTGIVFDTNGNPVVDATVFVESGGRRETRTDSAGRYILGDVSGVDLTVRARIDIGDQLFQGQNLARVYANESTPNVNITVFDDRDLIRVTGQVRDSGGRVVQGARVFARPTDGTTLSSTSALTDRNGFYTLNRLSAGIEYQIVASARGFGDDSAILASSNSTGERTQDLVLKNATTNAPDVPTGLDAVAFTTPGAPTTRGKTSDAQLARAYESVKRLLDPKRAARMKAAGAKAPGRAVSDSPVSIDLTWNEYPINLDIRPAGFIIYRNQPSPSVNDGYFLQDPLAVLFSDSDVNIVPGSSYTYTMRSVSTGFEDGSNQGRSALSDSVSTVPLAPLFLNAPNGNTVNWTSGSGADRYTVYVYDIFPDIDVAPVATTTVTGSNATSATVSDANVVSGRTYYYLVVGSRSDGSANSFTEVATFRP